MCVDVPWKVQVEEENVLNIGGEQKRNKKEEGKVKYIHMEGKVAKFMRKFTLPADCNLDFIYAACQDGVLTVTVPKLPPPEPKKPKNIEVKSG